MVHTLHILIPLLSLGNLLWGNSTHLVRGTGNRNPYLVVYASDAPDTNKAPGIYKVDDKGPGALILKGNVVGASATFSGVLSAFHLGAVTGREEAMAIVDGRIVIFSTQTKAGNRDTYVEIGSQRDKAVDILTKRPVQLPLIQSTSEVSLQSLQLHGDFGYGELILLSTKSRNALGDGFTLALIVSQSSNASLPVVSDISVIDYAFLDSKGLAQLHTRNGSNIVSQQLLRAYSAPQRHDFPLITLWREQVKKYSRLIANPNPSQAINREKQSLVSRVPLFDVITGGVDILEVPDQFLMEEPLAFRQHFNPITGNAVIATGANAVNGQAVGIQGTVDFDDDGNPIAYTYSEKDADEHNAVILSRAGRLWAALPIGGDHDNVGFVDLGIDTPDRRQKFSFVHHHFHPHKHFLLISQKTAMSSKTICMTIDEAGQHLNVVNKTEIFDRFVDAKELRARLIPHGPSEDDDPTQVLYDMVTPVIQSRRYDPKTERTTPYTDLLTGKQDYLFSVARLQVAPDILFEEYDPTGATEIRTGLYVDLGDEKPAFVPGLLLKKKKRSVFLDDDASKAFAGNPSAHFRILAVNPDVSRKGGSKEFRIVGVANPESDFFGTTFSFTVPAPFENLRGAKIVLGRRKSAFQMSVLVFLDGSKSASRGIEKTGGVLVQNFNLEFAYHFAPKRLLVKEVGGPGWLERESVPIATIKDRLMPDGSGSWFWIDDPALANTETRFAVKSLQNPAEKVYPRRAGSTVALRWEESLETNWGALLGGSDWLILGEFALTSAFPDTEKALKDHEEKESDKGFPALDDFLDRAAAMDGFHGPTLLLVDPTMKANVLQRMRTRLVTNRSGPWSFSSRHAQHFYYHEATEQGVSNEQFAEEARKIRADNTSKRRSLLVVDIEKVLPKDARQRIADKNRRSVAKAISSGGEEPPATEEDADQEDPAEEEEKKAAKEDESKAGDDSDDADGSLAEDEFFDEGSDTVKKVHGSPLLLLATGGEDLKPERMAGMAEIPSFPSIVVATPEEWRVAQEIFPREAAAFSRYRVNGDVLSSSWTLWNPGTERASKLTKALNRAATSKEEHEVFPDLEALLGDIVDLGKSPKRRILIVPDEIKALLDKLVLTRWASDSRSLMGPWNHHNPALSLFYATRILNGAKEGETRDLKQEDILDNFDSMRAIAIDRRPVLIGALDELLRIGRPMAAVPDNTFTIKDHGIRTSGSSLEGNTETDRSRVPHALWWIATEGRKIQPKVFEKKLGMSPSINSLFIGSERDWTILQSETEWESRFGLANQFEIVRLEAPSLKRRLDLVSSLFNKDFIKRYGYEYQLESIVGAEAQNQIVSLIVNRASQIARQHDIDETAAFIRAYAELSRTLTSDSRLRAEKKIDKYFVESLFARVFPVPIALNALPPTDPLHKLKDPVKAGVAIQNLGYDSAIDLKIRVIDSILGQTHGSTPGRPIPSSTILFGGTSTGKTYLFEVLMQYLGLKQYDPDVADNEEADYYIVKVRNLREKEDPAAPDSRGVDQELENISNFLAGPRGHRAFLLFDDIHLAKSTPIYTKIMAFIESLFEAKEGYITVKKRGKTERREIPVRNLNLFLTINPKRDQEIRDRYAAEGDLTGEILAALARSDYSVEDSFLARWSTIIDMSEFPLEARAPALVKEVRRAQEEDYRANPHIVVVTPGLLKSVVTGNRKANAREFLTAASRGLIQLDGDVPDAPVYLASEARAKDWGEQVFDTEGDRVEAYVKEHRVIKPVSDKEYGNQLEWIQLNVDAFRMHAAHAALQGARRDPSLSVDRMMRRNMLVPLFLSAFQYYDLKPHIPLSMIQIEPDDFGGSNSGERDFILRLIDSRAEADANFFPLKFGPRHGNTLPRVDDFLGKVVKENRQFNRADVISEVSRKIYEALVPMAAAFYRSDSLSPQSQGWFDRLEIEDPKQLLILAGDQLAAIYRQLGVQLFDTNLVEMLGDRPQMTSYDQAHFFWMAMDRAVLEFPWARLNRFVSDRLKEAAVDPSLGQMETFQNYLFRNRFSPFNPTTVDAITQTFDSLNERFLQNEGGKSQKRDMSPERCSALIAGAGV
ncbi:MAG: hypothetical protein HYR96_09835 [Deltaproteobacteria bacterium]|nr:hypothetical protein [Deltaproteobacteria bacterium]MBI3294394.1 hypothetical protein [Deltaproteobacteria bacterium]